MSLLTTLQGLVVTRLSSHSYFGGSPAIEVITEAIGDVEAAINRALMKVGAACLVMTPAIRPGAIENQADVDLSVIVSENVPLNRVGSGTQKAALDIAEAVWARLNDWQPSDEWTKLRVQGIERILPENTEQLSALLVYDVQFRASTIIAATEV